VLVVDTEAMAALHKQWMDLDGPTDVMAFPMDTLDTKPGLGGQPGPALLGDVILCPEVAAEQARSAGHTTEAELVLLLTHGVLHLLGYDHDEPAAEQRMFTLQAKLIADWVQRTGHDPVVTPRATGRAGDEPA
jgi:probable rRNA maturation factor